jgi:hypothetical protein
MDFFDGRSARRKAASLLKKTQTENKSRQTSMFWVAFEPTIPAFELTITYHALFRVGTMVGFTEYSLIICFIVAHGIKIY